MPDLAGHLGTWEGSWSTFLDPNQPYDEAPVKATISHDGDVLVIGYEGSIAGDFVTGIIRWSENDRTTTVDWVDSWHTNGQHEYLAGYDGEPPSYEYNGDDPWVWDITIETSDSGVTVTHHNAGPGAGVPRYVGVSMKLETRTS
ncbi:MAG: hypothetical protein U9N84_01990 [Actinomycetota bacterium]|nr:hypothetical protein [Actinomycetota bacterium]